MHADHLQPSATLIKRLKEMIEAMNYDPSFKTEMEASPFNDGYFLSVKGTVIGSYWLYMASHNCIQNLWFLLSSDNVGEKTASDPVEWLGSLEIGTEYFKYLESENKHIDKSDIFYTVSDGTCLKDSFIKWATEPKKESLKTCQGITMFKQKLKEKIRTTDSKKSLQQTRLSLELAYHSTLFGRSASQSSSQASSFPSLDTENSQELREEITQATRHNQRYQESKKQERLAIKESTEAVIAARRKRKATDNASSSKKQKPNSGAP